MEQQLTDIREQQKASWNKFSGGWKKWDDLTMDFLRPMGDEIITQLNLKETDVVLDIAAGTGEPGLTIATKVKRGKVIITDLADDMLAIAREQAESKGLKNVETIACDACELPFGDNTFDAISCRFGYMFFPDMLLAAKEMARVLKPGGRIAVATWNGPEQNFWATAILGAINKNMQITPPPPGAPGLFRCAKEGLISSLFTQAGLKNVSEKNVGSKMNFETADVYWSFMTEVVAPVVGALSQADGATREKVKADVFAAINQKYPHGKVMIEGGATVIAGTK